MFLSAESCLKPENLVKTTIIKGKSATPFISDGTINRIRNRIEKIELKIRFLYFDSFSI